MYSKILGRVLRTIRGQAAPVFGRCSLVVAAVALLMLYAPQPARAANWYIFHEIADYESLPVFFCPSEPWVNPLGAPSINSAGQVVFTAKSALHEYEIYRGKVRGLEKSFDVDSAINVTLGEECSINDLGDVGFWGYTNIVDTSVFQLREVTQGISTIARGNWNGEEDDAAFKRVRGASINNAGAGGTS